MKKFMTLVALGLTAVLFGCILSGCPSNGTPTYPTTGQPFTATATRTLTSAPTPTITNTPPGPTNTPTVTNTPGGATATPTLSPTITATGIPTLTPTITDTPTPSPTVTDTNTPTITPTPLPNPFVFYANGAFKGLGNTFPFSDGTSAYPGLNATDTSAGSACCSDTMSYSVNFTTLKSGGYSGVVYTAPSSVDMTSFNTCTFYAIANQATTVGFNAAEPSGDTANVHETLSTSWTPFSITITQGSRSDGNTGSMTTVGNYFVVVLTAAPGSFPLQVNFDQVSFQ